MNLYGFANGDPVNFSDPFGLMACPPCATAGHSIVVQQLGRAAGRTSAPPLFFVFPLNAGKLLGSPEENLIGGAMGLAGPIAGVGGRIGLRATQSWGRPSTLGRHFRDHGADLGARNADEYAGMASDFLQRSQREGLPTKVDADGVIRTYDRSTNTFGAYNADGTTRTFFKPRDGERYWARQPGAEP